MGHVANTGLIIVVGILSCLIYRVSISAVLSEIHVHCRVSTIQGVVNGPLKSVESRQVLPKSGNLAKPTNGSRSLRFCICRSHICFSIKSLHFFILGLDFKMPVSASQQVSDFTIRHP